MEQKSDEEPDWVIIKDIANTMGYDWSYSHPSEIMAESAELAPLFAGVDYELLTNYNSLQWPVDKDGTDTPLLFKHGFPFEDEKARLYNLDFEFDYSTNEEYDLHVNNEIGRASCRERE